MEQIINLSYIALCIIALCTTWRIYDRCKNVLTAAGTRYARLRSRGQFASRWLLTAGAVTGILWGKVYFSEALMYMAMGSHLLWAYRYYKAGGWLGRLLTQIKW